MFHSSKSSALLPPSILMHQERAETYISHTFDSEKARTPHLQIVAF